ncbi:hypothetical protein Bca4012_035092 [Brassica carinata]
MFKFNANALPFYPVKTDEHALFLTFSYGYPLSQMQIRNYFNRQLVIMIRFYGPVVETVNVHKPKPGRGPPLFGKIVFKQQHFPASLMGKKEKIHFIVEGRYLYCKKFVSKKSKSRATSLP